MTTVMDVSVVIVNWNTRELLLGLLGQLSTPPPGAPTTEVLVVDNDSGDGSVEAVQSAFPDVTVLAQRCNGGFAYGVNRGLERARGRHIVLINTDVELDWAALQRLVQYAEDHPRAGVVGPRITDESGAPQPSHWRAPSLRHHFLDAVFLGRLWDAGPDTSDLDRSVDCVSGCVFAIRREALDVVPRFDEGYFMYFEEVDYCERVRKAGFEVRFTPSAAMVHHGGLSSAKAREKTFLAFRRSCLRFHARNRGRVRAELVRASLALGSLLRLVPLLIFHPSRGKLHAKALRMLLRPSAVSQAARWANDHVGPQESQGAAPPEPPAALQTPTQDREPAGRS